MTISDKWWRGVGIYFAIIGYIFAEIVTFNLVITVGKLMGDNLTLSQMKALDSLYVYRYIGVLLITIIFWTSGTCLEMYIKKQNTKYIG